MKTKRIVTICSGNICRSPMAAEFLRKQLTELEIPHVVVSCGTLNIVGSPAASHAITACREIGVDLSGHRSQGLQPTFMTLADVIIVMEPRHERAVLAYTSDTPIVRLWEYTVPVSHFIYDPVNQDLDTFRRSRDEIYKAIENWITSYFEL